MANPQESHPLSNVPFEPISVNPWRVTATRDVYRNPWSVLREDHLEGPDGQPGLYGYFAARDSVLILPLFPDRTTILVRQWRHAFGCSSWELPCGACADGEAPAAAAARELAEEAQVAGAHWHALGAMHASDARCAGRIHGFLAEGLSPCPTSGDATECDMERERVSLADAVTAASDGRITHIASAWLLLRVANLR